MFIVQEGEVDIKIGDKIVETVNVDEFFGVSSRKFPDILEVRITCE